MALIPRRNPLTSLLNFAADRDREANSIGSVITKLAGPALGQLGVQTEEQPQPAVMRGPAPQAQPLGPMTGPAVAPTPVMSDAELKANVFPGESGGDYNALYGYANRPGQPFEGVNLTDMTVNEVIDFTDPSGPYGQWVRSTPSFQKTDAYKRGLTATPTGAFQVVGTTLKDAVKGLGLTGDEPYNEATQDAIGRWIFENQGPEAWEAWGKSGGSVSAGGGDTRLGGGAGADNLESVFAGLYDAEQAAADEKKAKRKDFFSAVSQGLSALSQGRPIDFSNIAANAQERRKAAAAEAKDATLRRMAGTYILNRYNDPEAAKLVFSGAMGVGDILSMREQDQLYAQRAAQIEATEAGQNAVRQLVLDRGGSQEEADAAAAAPDFYLSLSERQDAADKAETEQLQKTEELQGMTVTAQRWLESGDPGKIAAAEEYLALPNDTAKMGYDLFARAKDYAPKGEAAPPTAMTLWNDARTRLVDTGIMTADEFAANYGATPADYETSNAARTGTGLGLSDQGQLGISGEGAAPPLPEQSPATSVFSVAPSTTGALASLQKLGANTLGQLTEFAGFGPIAQDVVAAQQRFSAWRTNAINALKTNERVLAQELALITQELAPESGALQSPATLQTKLVEIDSTLRRRLESELARANDTNIPVKDRQEARKIADDINYVLQTLHEPVRAAAAPQAAPVEEAPVETAPVGEVVETVLPAGTVIIDADGNERPLAAGEQPQPGDTVRLPDGTVGVIE
jgi:hypothetical protein